MGDENLASNQVPRKWREIGVEDNRDFDGTTAQITLGVGKCHMRVRNDGDCEGGREYLRLHSQ